MNYNLEHYVYMNLKRLGHQVVFYGYRDRIGRLANPVRMGITRSKWLRSLANVFWLNKVNEEIKRLAEEFRHDLVLSIKGEVVKPETIKWISNELSAKTALWYPDDPRFFNSLIKYTAPSYDYVFTSSEKAVEMYKEIGCERVYFLPFACEPTVHKRMELTSEEKEIYGSDVVFVGTYTMRRARLIEALKKAGVKVKVYGPYWKYFKRGCNVHNGVYGPEMVKAFNASKVVLNIHIEEDLMYKPNMRTFEATGSESFLLTDKPYGLEKMFVCGSELVCYEDEKEFIELAKYYLEHEDERVKVGERGRERAYREHIYQHRIKELMHRVS